MTDLEKAARMALEALEYYQIAGLATTRVVDSITALRQAISDSVEQPAQQQEPVDWEAVAADQAMTIALLKAEQPAQQESVGYVYSVHGERIKNACIKSDVPNGTPLYTSPQRKPWVGLTWDDMPDSSCDDPAFLAGAQWANSKLKEKNA